MEINATSYILSKDSASADIVSYLKENEDSLGLQDAQLYYDFPILKDLEDVIVVSKLLLVSAEHGVIAIAPSNITVQEPQVDDHLIQLDVELDQVLSLVYSRLLRNKVLRRERRELMFPTSALIYAPFLQRDINHDIEADFARDHWALDIFISGLRSQRMSETTFMELVSTIEGAKGLIRPKLRPSTGIPPTSKGNIANGIEAEIANFDHRQKLGALGEMHGLERVRGLAGSGKTVVLAMKAALTHLRNPDAIILYTFHTKSLYQHIQRLITRFYRQFDDKDPDWSRLLIMHAWGGKNLAGVYYNASTQAGVKPLSFSEAASVSLQPFDYVCRRLLSSTLLRQTYDYVFVDEGQDFPSSFIQLCLSLAIENRLVFAYDDLQTIFQATTPDLRDIIGADEDGNPLVELLEDTILYRCYRNPREVLVCAHALGFGIYGEKIVQMLENQAQWADIGYRVLQGSFVEGDHTIIERPAAHNLTYISEHQQKSDIVQTNVYDTFEEEVEGVANSIFEDINSGLRPDDILVVVADDRAAKAYMRALEIHLQGLNVQTNNIHSDPFGIRDFNQDGAVTLSTVHKAKGNEAFMVYVTGVDALFNVGPTVRDRNLLFTAITRAKGWVRISGIGIAAALCKHEIDLALAHYPNLVFDYPGPEELRILRRDLAASAMRKQEAQRKLDALVDEMGIEEVADYLKTLSGEPSKRKRR